MSPRDGAGSTLSGETSGVKSGSTTLLQTEEDMRISVKARHLPPRIAAGAFILNSGINKLSADDEAAARRTAWPPAPTRS